MHNVAVQKRDVLQEMVMVPANPYLPKEARGSPTHQTDNATSAFLAINFAGTIPEQTLAACFSVVHLEHSAASWTAVKCSAMFAASNYLQARSGVLFHASFAKVAASQHVTCAHIARMSLQPKRLKVSRVTGCIAYLVRRNLQQRLAQQP